MHNVDYWKAKFDYIEWKYEFLLKNWQGLLLKEVEQERQIMEQDKVISALQATVKRLTRK